MEVIKVFSILFIFCFISNIQAQLEINTQLRPRFEYRHGYRTLFPDNEDPASFVSQRTRLNSRYTTEKLKVYLSLQDVRTWGDVPQLNAADKNGFSIHEAWGEIFFNPNLSLKIGRQEIVYDDQRIFGNVGWAQQARSHDAALLKYSKEAFLLALGFAYNQDGEALTGNILTTPNTYKSLQYARAYRRWENLSAIFLFLNNGLQYIDEENSSNNETRYSQTIGSHIEYSKANLKVTSNIYYQFGKDIANNQLSAYLLGIDGSYKFSNKITATLGGEIQSGNNNGNPAGGKNEAFTPFYGTNHKFNGLIDYFYVGNHFNNVGLIDLYLKTRISINPKNNINIAGHNFMAAADIADTGKQLGTEVDIVYTYIFNKDINFKAGYSHMFASKGMEVIKNNFDDNTNNWGWVMVTINPTLFKSESNK